MSWMAWTWQTAAFFSAIGLALAAMTWAEVRWPTKVRQGFLPMPTTRGDRFFISLLGSAVVHVAWLAATGAPVGWASMLCVGYAGALMRYG